MKKSILIPVICCLLTGCGNVSDSTQDKAEMQTEITSTEAAEATEETEETTVTTDAPAKTEAIQTTSTAELPTEPIKADSWQRGYVKYINKFWGDREPYKEASYDLIYLDDNDIPELFICTGYEAGGEYIVTFFDGEIYEQHLSRIGTAYIEKSGLLFTATGHMGVYPVTITELKNGRFDLIASGSHDFKASEEEGGYYALDENGYPITEYKWEDNIVSEDEFYENIDSIFDRSQKKYPGLGYSLEEILSVLNTGQCTSYGHTYELIQADISWEEAQKLCHEKGGYLATLTSPDEQKTIISTINEEGMQDISFYVGFRCYEKVNGEGLYQRWVNADGGFNYNVKIAPYYSAPDYDSRNGHEWDYDEEDCGLIKYYTSTDQIYLFEAPENLTEVSPEYSGKMGYICEYDN